MESLKGIADEELRKNGEKQAELRSAGPSVFMLWEIAQDFGERKASCARYFHVHGCGGEGCSISCRTRMLLEFVQEI